jgi:steroid delta-isomerase-like uncharacterized protein
MSETENRRVIEEAFAAFNAHDVDRYVEHLDESYVWESDAFPVPVRGQEAVKQTLQMYFRAFPDLRLEVEQIIVSGDYAVVRWIASGTHEGEFNGIAPTNRVAQSRGCTVDEIRNGLVVKSCQYSDQLALLQQLGAAPGKAAAAAS